MASAVVESVRRGANVIDSAINYRYQYRERSVGKGIRRLLESGEASRDELIICTKGGVVPHPTPNHVDWFYQQYVEPNNSTVSMADLAQERYCIHPEYIQDRLNWSLANLGIETIDVYYLHNPEKLLSQVEPDTFYNRLREVFEVLEGAVLAEKIANYGVATWNAFRVPPTERYHIDLARAKSIAREVAGNKEDRFRFIQLPLNMGMPEAVLTPTQTIEGEQVSVLEAADRLGIWARQYVPVSSAGYRSDPRKDCFCLWRKLADRLPAGAPIYPERPWRPECPCRVDIHPDLKVRGFPNLTI